MFASQQRVQTPGGLLSLSLITRMSGFSASPRDEQDPNLSKNRLPTALERTHLQRMVDRELGALTRIEADIKTVSSEINENLVAITEYEAAIAIFHKLAQFSRFSLSTFFNIAQDLSKIQENTSSTTEASAPRHSSLVYAEALQAKKVAADHAQEEMHRVTRERGILDDRLEQLKAELEGSTSTLVFSRQSLIDLQLMHERLFKSIQAKKHILSARRRVPAEVWEKIFEELVHEEEGSYERAGRKRKPPYIALTLGAVCQFWRKTAEDYPPLWQYVVIPCDEHVSESQYNRLNHYAKRLRSLHPYVYVSPTSRAGSKFERVEVTLTEHWLHFHTLELRYMAKGPNISAIIRNLDAGVGELRLVGSYSVSRSSPTVELDLSSLRKAESLSYSFLRPVLVGDAAIVPEGSLVKARFIDSVLHFDDLVTALQHMPHVELIEINSTFPYKVHATLILPITLETLKSIRCRLDVLTTCFTEKVALPNLQHIVLDMQGSSVQRACEWKRFLAVHQRRETVSMLTLDAPPLNNVSDTGKDSLLRLCVDILRETPNLEELTLVKGACALTLDGIASADYIPPKLQKLSLIDSSTGGVDLVPFVELYWRKMGRSPTLLLNSWNASL